MGGHKREALQAELAGSGPHSWGGVDFGGSLGRDEVSLWAVIMVTKAGRACETTPLNSLTGSDGGR